MARSPLGAALHVSWFVLGISVRARVDPPAPTGNTKRRRTGEEQKGMKLMPTIALVLGTALLLSLTLAAPLPEPSWSTSCPGQTGTFFAQCSNVTVYQDWTSVNGPTASFWLGRSSGVGPIPTTTVWYIGETCLEDHLTRPGDWANAIESYGYYVVEVHVRGSAYTWPTLDCGAANSDATGMPNLYCAGNISKGVPLESFSFAQIANDLNFAISKLGTQQNIILTDGLGTLIAQRLQNMFPNAANGYVLGGLTEPSKFNLFNSLMGYEPAMGQVLSYCVDQPLCAAKAAGGQDMWQVFRNVMAAAADNSLPCNKQLHWPVSSYATAYSNIFAMLLSSNPNTFVATNANTLAFIPAVLYRLQRCNANDVNALTHLYNALNASAVPQQMPPLSGCSFSPAQRYTYVFNEMMLQPPPALETLLQQASAQLVYPPFDYIQQVYPLYATWPKYQVAPQQLVLGGSNVLTYALAGDVDVVMPFALAEAAYLSMTQKGGNYKFFRLPAVPHMPLGTNDFSCVLAALRNVQNATLPAYSCPGVLLDFFGQNPGTDRQQYFGIDDIWQFDAIQPPIVPTGNTPQPAPRTPIPSSPPAPPNDDSDDLKKAKDTAAAFIVLWVLTLIGIIGYYCYNRRKSGSLYDGKGDFYTNLNRAT